MESNGYRTAVLRDFGKGVIDLEQKVSESEAMTSGDAQTQYGKINPYVAEKGRPCQHDLSKITKVR